MRGGYSPLLRTFALLACLALLLPAGTTAISEGEAAAAKRKRCVVVVFKRRGKTIRRCRKKPTTQRPATPAPTLTPSLPAVPAPTGAATETSEAPQPPAPPEPNREEVPQPEPERDPWFLTMHARDTGNGDFRLSPNPGTIPAGALYLSLKNEDETEHDLRLRGLSPQRDEQVIFEASSTKVLRRTRLEIEAGRYELLCGLPGHEQMRQTFGVAP